MMDKLEEKLEMEAEIMEEMERKGEEEALEEMDMTPQEITDAVEGAKKAGLRPYWIMLNGFHFIYRPINRKEWREMTRSQNKEMLAAQDDTEKQVDIKNEYTEKTVIQCLIYSDIPVDDSLGAGYVDTLFDAILVDSGFGQPDMPSVNMS